MNQDFFVVGTPIGNLEDISSRALKVLSSVDFVLCEDTRVTKKLLDRYGIKTLTLSYHARSDDRKSAQIFELVATGKRLALVTDAGTPGLSDPGSELVGALREKFPELNIVSVPGASALVAALSIAGVPSSEFLFLGFLPHKKGRETLFKEIAQSERTVVFYESPHRILKSLEKLSLILAKDRKVVVCREITKIFESTVSGAPEEVLEHYKTHSDQVRGEFVVLVRGL